MAINAERKRVSHKRIWKETRDLERKQLQVEYENGKIAKEETSRDNCEWNEMKTNEV